MFLKKINKDCIKAERESGIILIALIVLVVLSSIVFSIGLHVWTEQMDEARIERTKERLLKIQAATIGHPYMFQNDAGSNLGHFSRSESFPNDVNVLSDMPANLEGLTASSDAYGREIKLVSNASDYIFRSYGKDGAEAGGDDIELSVNKPSWDKRDIQIQIMDATVSGDLLSEDYVRDDGTANVLDSEYDGHVIFDNDDLDVSVSLTGDADVVASWDGATKTFRWDSITAGHHVLHIKAKTTNANFDPTWVDSTTDSTTNLLKTTLFVAPWSTQRQHFNVIYPVVAKAYYLRDGLSGSNIHIDKTIDDSNNNHDNLDYDSRSAITEDDSIGEMQVVGRGNVDFSGITRSYRAMLQFDLTKLPNINISNTNPSKIVFAKLRLHAQRNSYGTVKASGANSNRRIMVFCYDKAFGTESNGTNWNDTHITANKQDEWIYNTSTFFHDFDVFEAVKNWVNTSSGWVNNGFLLRYSGSSSNPGNSEEQNNCYWCFKSQESNSSAGDSGTSTTKKYDKRPKLIVAYYP